MYLPSSMFLHRACKKKNTPRTFRATVSDFEGNVVYAVLMYSTVFFFLWSTKSWKSVLWWREWKVWRRGKKKRIYMFIFLASLFCCWGIITPCRLLRLSLRCHINRFQDACPLRVVTVSSSRFRHPPFSFLPFLHPNASYLPLPTLSLIYFLLLFSLYFSLFSSSVIYFHPSPIIAFFLSLLLPIHLSIFLIQIYPVKYFKRSALSSAVRSSPPSQIHFIKDRWLCFCSKYHFE